MYVIYSGYHGKTIINFLNNIYMKMKNWVLPLLLVGVVIILINNCDSGSKNDDIGTPIDSTGNDTSNLFIPAGWSKVGDLKANDMIWSLTSDASGNIYAAGYFTNAGKYHYVAKWNGTAWSELGSLNANSSIYAITTDAGGNIYATGDFSNGATSDGGVKYVARWNGSNWTDIGGGGGLILTADSSGNIYQGTTKWNGSVWSNICPICTLTLSSVRALASNAAGSIQYAGGDFMHDNGYRYVARCDGSNCWSEIGNLNANSNIQSLVTDNSGNVYAGGDFTNGSLNTNGYRYVAKWNGSVWSELGSLNANGTVYSLAVDIQHGYLYASGYFSNSKGEYYVAKWDGATWSDLGNMGLAPTPIMVAASGKLYSVIASKDAKYYVVVHD
jgi:hypothetical protein